MFCQTVPVPVFPIVGLCAKLFLKFSLYSKHYRVMLYSIPNCMRICQTVSVLPKLTLSKGWSVETDKNYLPIAWTRKQQVAFCPLDMYMFVVRSSTNAWLCAYVRMLRVCVKKKNAGGCSWYKTVTDTNTDTDSDPDTDSNADCVPVQKKIALPVSVWSSQSDKVQGRTFPNFHPLL